MLEKLPSFNNIWSIKKNPRYVDAMDPGGKIPVSVAQHGQYNVTLLESEYFKVRTGVIEPSE